MSKPKFVKSDVVTCAAGEGTIEETVQNPDGSFQHRVRVDFMDAWFPEKDIKPVRYAIPDEPAKPEAPSAPVVKPKRATTKKAARKRSAPKPKVR